MADYQMNEKLESSTPESFTGSEDSDDSEHGYRQQQAKHILNKVFQALSITPILDTRNTGALKRDVTRAIQGIRKLADELCHVPSTKTLKSNVTLLTTEENVSLIDGLKRLFDSSDYDDQVRLLTLSPPTWGRVQIENFFFCNEWQSRRALEIRGSFGILATPTNFSGNPRINPLLVDEIQAFYQEDIISRQTSNKKDVIHVKKQPIPVRFMNFTVGQAYAVFLKKLKDRDSLESVSRGMFYSLKPKCVKILKPHDVCACIYHENFDFLIQGWNKMGLTKIESKMLISDLVCHSPTEECFFNECRQCRDNQPSEYLKHFLDNQISLFDDCSWMIWRKSVSSTEKSNGENSNADKKILLQKNIGSVEDLLEEFDCQWKTYVKHSYITSQQSSYIKMIKDQADEHETIVVHMDFAENHTLLAQNEITQAHWTNQQATLFTVHIKTAKEKHHSLIIISDYLAYDVEFVHTAQSIISDYVKSIYPTVKQLNYVSDGAPQHFKNNKSILNLTYHQVDFGIPVSWSFSATAHGKGAVDGIGAAVKYRTTRMVLSGTTSDAILTPEDLYKFTQSDSSMNVFYMNQKRIKNHCEKYQLLNRWNRDKPEGWINQVRSQHQFDPVGIKKVRCRLTSTSLITQIDSLID
ncbi:unnamed protein product [Rotaria magnacalcarata]